MCFRYWVFLLGLLSSHGAWGKDWAGTWIFQYGPGAQFAHFVIRQGNGDVKVWWDGTPIPDHDVSLSGDRLRMRMWEKPGALEFVGTRKGDALLLTSNYLASGDYPGEDEKEFHRIEAHRVSAAEWEKIKAGQDRAVKGVRLPLPPLRDVPDNGLVRTPPMGWGNWVGTNDRTVREIADAIVTKGFRDAGYIYLVLDSGWQGNRDTQGRIHPNENFADMRALADYVHTRGLKLGLYSSPGPLDCTYRLGSHGYEEQDARTYAQWGVDYLKYDWCTAEELYKAQPEVQAVYQKMGEALRSSGRPIVYSLAQTGMAEVGSWGPKAGGNLWRISGDGNNTYDSIIENGFSAKSAPENAGPGRWNDPDVLQIGKGMTDEEDRTQMTLWALLAAPLIMSNDPRNVRPETAEILLNKEVIAVDQDVLAKQGRRVKKGVTTEVWSKSLSNGALAVAMFNRGEKPADVDVLWLDLGINGTPLVRDLWSRTDLGPVAKGYRAKVPTHGAVLLRLSRAK